MKKKRDLLFSVGLFFVLCFAAGTCPAQQPKKNKKDVLPRVGAIKNYELLSPPPPGCNSHSVRRNEYTTKDIYLSNPDGSNAWMNLDGRDVELRLVKTTLYYRGQYGDAHAFHEYRAGATRITVSFLQLTDYIFYFPAKIVLRKGRATRTIRAVVAPQCD